MEWGAQTRDGDTMQTQTCLLQMPQERAVVPGSLSAAHGRPCWGTRWRTFRRITGNHLLRGRCRVSATEPLLEVTSSRSGTSSQKRPELEAGSFLVGDRGRGPLGPWSIRAQPWRLGFPRKQRISSPFKPQLLPRTSGPSWKSSYFPQTFQQELP